MSEKEEWRDVVGYDKYIVSSNGSILRVEKDGSRHLLKSYVDKDGYARVSMLKNNAFKGVPIHRVVGKAFVHKNNGCDYAYHKDLDRTNNKASNIAWGDISVITKRMSDTLRANPPKRTGLRGKFNKYSIPVVQLTSEGDFIGRFDSMSDAARSVGSTATRIKNVADGDRISAAGYVWMREDYYNDNGFDRYRIKSLDNVLNVISKWRNKINDRDIDSVLKYDEIIVRASAIYLGIHEEWIGAYGFEEFYMVSSFGRVKSLDRDVPTPRGYTIFKKGRILRPSGLDYSVVKMQYDGKIKTEKVHRLVAKSFMRGADFSLEVNHIDFDKRNNYLGNLEFCTKSHNIEHMRNCLKKLGKKWYVDKSGMMVIQMTLDNKFVRKFVSISEAARITDCYPSSIGDCCKGFRKRHSAGGYRWMYAKDYYKNNP